MIEGGALSIIDREFSSQIYQHARDAGYENCGIVPLSALDGYADRLRERAEKLPAAVTAILSLERFFKVSERWPWARALVICTRWYGQYRVPPSLLGRYAKSYLLAENSVPDSPSNRRLRSFRTWLEERRQCVVGEDFAPGSVIPLRWIAVAAGLGIFRRNNFFYTAKGSWYGLDGFVIDRDCELIHQCDVKPCPPGCTICRRACPTGALCDAFTLNPGHCVSYLSTFARGKIPAELDDKQLGRWVFGCDACQDVCPYNRHDWSVGKDFSGLDDLGELFDPENILAARALRNERFLAQHS